MRIKKVEFVLCIEKKKKKLQSKFFVVILMAIFSVILFSTRSNYKKRDSRYYFRGIEKKFQYADIELYKC